MTRAEGMLTVGTGVLVALAGVGWYGSAPRAGSSARTSPASAVDVGYAAPESIDAASRAVIETDPFRFARRPAAIAYRPDLEGLAPPPRPPKPVLGLSGVVGNAALIDGIPGHAATSIVRVGDTLGGLRIRRIGRDTVVVSGADTTWRLTVRRPWQ
jgi:hypothetical protein